MGSGAKSPGGRLGEAWIDVLVDTVSEHNDEVTFVREVYHCLCAVLKLNIKSLRGSLGDTARVRHQEGWSEDNEESLVGVSFDGFVGFLGGGGRALALVGMEVFQMLPILYHIRESIECVSFGRG
jgi:hypothetical protein